MKMKIKKNEMKIKIKDAKKLKKALLAINTKHNEAAVALAALDDCINEIWGIAEDIIGIEITVEK